MFVEAESRLRDSFGLYWILKIAIFVDFLKIFY